MKLKIFYCTLLFLLLSMDYFAQTVLTITDAGSGNSGSADVILSQAETLANSGQNVTVNMNAPSLCAINTIFLTASAGSINIQKDPAATTTQGFGLSSYGASGIDYGLMFYSPNESLDVVIKDITFQNYPLPIVVFGSNDVTIDNVFISDCGSFVEFDDYYGPGLCTHNVLITNCVYENNTGINWGRPTIYRQNQENGTPHKTFKVINNQFKTHINVQVGTNAIVDDLDIEITGNISNSAGNWEATIGWYDYISSGAHRTNDYGFNLIFANNTDVGTLYLGAPMNDWKIENNTIDSKNFSRVLMGISAYPFGSVSGGLRQYKTSFVNTSSPYCSNQSYSNSNNTFIYRSNYPTSPVGIANYYWSLLVNGSNSDACALTEITDLDLPGAVIIGPNVSLRRCKVFASAGVDKPISSSTGITATLPSFLVSSGNLSFNYSYAGITLSNNNDLYVDVYKSNANGDLLDYIGEQFIPEASITGNSSINIAIPSGVTLAQTDRIAITLTGLHPQSSSNVVAIGTSNAFYNLSPCCEGGNLSQQGWNNSPAGVFINFSSPYSPGGKVCITKTFTLAANGCSSGLTYTWDFGDGTTSTGQTVTHSYATTGAYTVTFTASGSACSTTTRTFGMNALNNCSCTTADIQIPEGTFCVNNSVGMSVNNCSSTLASFNWSFGDGVTATGGNVFHTYQYPGSYNIQLTVIQPGVANIVVNRTIVIEECVEVDCKDCIGSFQPSPGNYIISVWVKEDITPLPQSYGNAHVEIDFTGVTGSSPLYVWPDGSKNKIIDGWQRIEENFTIPSTATNLILKLVNTNAGSIDAYFDDIRIFPTDGQMKTYVYDPITLRLTAMLDENNYATFYEYDEEGKLIRVKKETEKGIMTIQESREGNKKK